MTSRPPAAADVRDYRESGDLRFDLSVPPPDGLFTKLEVEDQGLAIAFVRSPLDLWEVRVNPAGGGDIVFPSKVRPDKASILSIRLIWKRGGQMTLWMNGKLMGSQPFTPPEIS